MADKNNDFLDFNLPSDAYAAFDAVSLKDFIIKRLNENEKFTDQNFEGSNLAAVIDIIAYSYHVLLFYLNNTAAETSYDQASLYENMNKIVKTIGYKPTGKQTSLASINAAATAGLGIGNYTIRKYSYFLVDNIQYTFNDDYSFTIPEAKAQPVDALTKNVVLFQGTIGEYPDYIAQGQNFETLNIVVDNILDSTDGRFIADNTISVYVKEKKDNTYYTYREVDSLYIADKNARVFEKRLNENGHFVIKFGNGISGNKLAEGDIVSVNYILSDNVPGIISKNAINGNKLFTYDSTRQRNIFNDTYNNKSTTIFINTDNSSLLNFNNPSSSSPVVEEETIEQIRENAPATFNAQLRLVSTVDYEAFIKKNFFNIITDSTVVNNKSYIDEYIQYFYNICVDPDKSNRVLINQVNFADSCDFNNVNIFLVPRFNITTDGEYPTFLSNSLKGLIVDSANERKSLSQEVVPRDPIYMAYDLGISNTADLTTDVSNNTVLTIVRESRNKISKERLKSQVVGIIKAFFDSNVNTLAQTLEINTLTSSILSVEGIQRIETRNTSENVSFNGLSFLTYNPLYPDVDIEIINQNITLPFFKYPYFINPVSLANKINVIDE